MHSYFNCLTTGHPTREWSPKKRQYFHCRWHHNIALCKIYKREEVKGNSGAAQSQKRRKRWTGENKREFSNGIFPAYLEKACHEKRLPSTDVKQQCNTFPIRSTKTWTNEITDFLAEKGITLKNITQPAPWGGFSGLYERLIGLKNRSLQSTTYQWSGTNQRTRNA